MDKNTARKMYELADRLSKVDVSTLNEQQLAERESMIQALRQQLPSKVSEQTPTMGEPGGGSAPEQHPRLGAMNIRKMGMELGVDGNTLKAAIQRGFSGQNLSLAHANLLATAFINLLQADDQKVQVLANIIKAGNAPKTTREESLEQPATVAEADSEITQEAARRVDKIFDFSDFKG